MAYVISFVVTCLNTIELRHRFFIFHPPNHKEIVESGFIFVIFWSVHKLCSPTFCQRARVCQVVYYNSKLHLHYMYVRVRYKYIIIRWRGSHVYCTKPSANPSGRNSKKHAMLLYDRFGLSQSPLETFLYQHTSIVPII